MSDVHDRADLRADCTACVALCCVAPPFQVSADFPIHKPAGMACPNLTTEYRCSIHDRLRQDGFYGCATFDCFGAGPRATRAFGERTWRSDPADAPTLFAVFGVLRLLHEILWYLAEAVDRLPDGALRAEASELRQRTRRVATGRPEDLVDLDVMTQQRHAGGLLERVSLSLRQDPQIGVAWRGADLARRRLQGADLRRADLRASCLIRADLRGADLGKADVLGADLRGADLRSANLVDAIFLTQAQVQAAVGDPKTVLPPVLTRPSHWR